MIHLQPMDTVTAISPSVHLIVSYPMTSIGENSSPGFPDDPYAMDSVDNETFEHRNLLHLIDIFQVLGSDTLNYFLLVSLLDL